MKNVVRSGAIWGTDPRDLVSSSRIIKLVDSEKCVRPSSVRFAM